MKKIIVRLFIAVGQALASAGAQADRLVFKGSDTLGAKLSEADFTLSSTGQIVSF